MMKKLICLVVIGFLLVMNLPINRAYVYPVENYTISPKIDGDVRDAISETRDDAGYDLKIMDDGGFIPQDFRGYASFNTTPFFNSFPNRRLVFVTMQIDVPRLIDWDVGDDIIYRRLNLTDISSSLPNATSMTDLIKAGNELASENTWGVETRNVSINAIFTSVIDLRTQRPAEVGDGYFSIGWEKEADPDEDEELYINSTEGGNPPTLIIQSDCLPPVSEDNWVLNETCVITDETVQVSGNLTIQDSGDLILNGTTLVNFTTSKSQIKINGEGQFSLDDTAEIRFY